MRVTWFTESPWLWTKAVCFFVVVVLLRSSAPPVVWIDATVESRPTEDVGYQGSYNLYSGVAHAELPGLGRLMEQTGTLRDGTPVYDAGPDPRATHSAAQGALKAMMGSMERIVFLFGWTAPGRSEDVGAWIDHVNDELARLKEW